MSENMAQYLVTQRGLSATFKTAFKKATPFYPTVCSIMRSKGADEKYAWLGKTKGMREWLGDRVFNQIKAYDYTIANRDWENSIRVEKNDIDDDRIGLYAGLSEELAEAAAYHPDELLVEMMDNAESAECFDGQYFFDTDHSWGDSGSQSNDLSSTVASTSAITADEFKASFHQALIQMLGFKDDRGKTIVRTRAGKLGNLVCVVPLEMYESAVKAFEQVVVANGESNFFLERPTIIPLQDLSSSIKWDLYHVGGRMKPYVFQERTKITAPQWRGAEDPNTKELRGMVSGRYNVGYLAWWTAVRTTLTT